MKIDIYTLHRDLAEYLRAAPESQMRIARETGVSQSTLSRIMLGQCRPRIDTVQTLVRWLAKRRRQRLAVRVPKGALQPGHVVGQADVAPGQQLDQAALPAAAVPASSAFAPAAATQNPKEK